MSNTSSSSDGTLTKVNDRFNNADNALKFGNGNIIIS